MQFRISIAMASFNGKAYVSEQIKSCLAQTTLPDELVISDDDSSDNTVLVAKAALEESHVDFILKQNSTSLGYSQNFNQALELTSGDIIFLSDQDDVWQEEKLTIVRRAFEQSPKKYLIIHDLAYCDENLKLIGQTKLERLKSIGASHRSYVTGMATAIRRELLDVCLPIPANPLITHDLWLHECAYALNVKKVIPDVLAWYRRHGQNVTNSFVINSAKKTNIFSFIKKQNIEKMKIHAKRRVELLKELISWSHRDDVSRFCLNELEIDKNALEIIRNKINVELTFAKRRLELYSRKPLMRIMLAIKLYLDGGYASFMGMKSLLKDILL